MSKLKSSLKKKIGPLPVYAWLAVIGGAIVLGLYLRRRNAGGNADNTGMDSADLSSLGDSESGPIPGTAGGGAGGGGVGGSGSDGGGGGTFGDIGIPLPSPSLPGAFSDPYSYGYGYPAGDLPSATPQDTGAAPVPAPTTTQSAAHAPAPNYQFATLANGSQLRFNPATGIVTQKAAGSGATWYRAASGISDFQAYVARVRSKASTSPTVKKRTTAGHR